jgi:fatty acid desaturase
MGKYQGTNTLDHETALASLDPKERRALVELSDAEGLRRLLGHFAAIAISGAWIFLAGPFWLGVLVLHGILLVFLFTPLHETSHRTPFKTNWINSVVGHICGFLLFLPANWFRYFHLAHHRHTQVPGKDPELESPKPVGWADYALHISGLPVWVSQAKALFSNATGRRGDHFVPRNRRPLVTNEARAYLAGYVGVAAISLWLQTHALLHLWLIPILLGQPFLRLFLLAEHSQCAFVANMFENTRTTYTNRIIRTLAWNMPYHAEHHSYPGVPFHKLPKLNRLVAPHLRAAADGYASFNREYVAGFHGQPGQAPKERVD